MASPCDSIPHIPRAERLLSSSGATSWDAELLAAQVRLLVAVEFVAVRCIPSGGEETGHNFGEEGLEMRKGGADEAGAVFDAGPIRDVYSSPR